MERAGITWADLTPGEQVELTSMEEAYSGSFTLAVDGLAEKGLTDCDGQLTERGRALVDRAVAAGHIVPASPGRYRRARCKTCASVAAPFDCPCGLRICSACRPAHRDRCSAYRRTYRLGDEVAS